MADPRSRAGRSHGAGDKLAYMYFEGRGVGRDYEKALEWYQRAADAGYAPAQSMISSMHFSGPGARRDRAVALAYLNLAIDNGLKELRHTRDLAAGQMTKQEIERARRLFRELRAKTPHAPPPTLPAGEIVRVGGASR